MIRKGQERFMNDPHLPLTACVNLAHSLRDPSKISLKDGDEIGLANGWAGIAFLPLTLASLFPEQDWLDVAGSYVACIAQESSKRPLSHPGLYHGSCGVAFTLSLLAEQDGRYHHASQVLLSRLIKQILSWDWYIQPLLPGQHNFEVIGGVAGITRFLLTRSHEEGVHAALEHLLTYLIWVCEKQERWVHHPDHLGDRAKKQYPQGYIDLGIAHGLAGPLAVLSLAILHNYTLPGMREAIAHWSTWLLEQQLVAQWGIDWPSVIPLPLYAKNCQPTHALAWCYGTPGIARTLWLAGCALADLSLCAIAREALASSLRRRVHAPMHDDPQVCHGLAGLLLICLRFARDDTAIGIPGLQEAISQLTTAVWTCWQATYTQMSPSFLTGAVGGALTILAAVTNREPLWDQVLLLS